MCNYQLKFWVYSKFRWGIDESALSSRWDHISDLDGNVLQLSEEESARAFDAVLGHPSLSDVSLGNYLGQRNGYDNLLTLLTTKPKIETVWYRDNNVATDGDSRLTNYLATNPPLGLLALDGNELVDADAMLIAEALRTNTNLSRLDIGGNNFSEVGLASPKKAILDETSLNVLSDCNHSCQINIGHNSELINYWSRTRCRAEKMYKVLSKRNKRGMNVDCLKRKIDNDALPTLFPNVLSRVSYYHEAGEFQFQFRNTELEVVPPLSIMYEMIRKAPDLSVHLNR